MSALVQSMLSLAMLASFVLLLGGIILLWRGEDRKRGWLMLAAAAVLIGNVVIASI